jgi:hypothetical protein
VEFEKTVEFVSKKLDDFEEKCKELSEQGSQGHQHDIQAVRKDLDTMIKD